MFYFFNGAKKKTSLLIDSMSTKPAVSYSLRKLTKSATRAIRVRRSSDNAELDIGFAGNGLDTGTLSSFVGTENLWLQSESMATSPWTLTNATSPVSGSTPDGLAVNNFTAITTDTSGRYVIQQFTKATSSLQYTVSLYAKAGTFNYLSFRFDRSSANGVYATFNLTNGTLTEGSTAGSGWTFISGSSVSVGSGWYRLSITLTTGTEDYVRMIIFPSTSATPGFGPTNHAATSGDILTQMTGAQVNSGATANTYNKTTVGVGGNGLVATWYDQSDAKDASIGTASSQPSIVLAGAINVGDNGQPVLVFDGTDDYLQSDTSTVLSGSVARSMFVSYKNNLTTSYTGSLIGQASGAAPGNWSMLQTRQGAATGDPYFSGFSQDLTGPSPVAAWKLAGFTYAGGAAGTSYLYKNGTQVNTGSLTLNTQNSPIYIGRDTGATRLSGRISEALLYTVALTTEERKLVEKNLGANNAIVVA